MAPPGQHFMSVFVQYVPYALAEGPWSPEMHAQYEKDVLDTIEASCPGFRKLILHVQTRTPWDIENEVGITEGNIFHGELTLDQLLFNRPFPGFGQYRGPFDGLLYVRLRHPSRRRRHGRARRQCGAGDPARLQEPGDPVSAAYDAIVIGGGHNGLTAAAYLGKAGLQDSCAWKPPTVRRRRGDAGIRAGIQGLRRRPSAARPASAHHGRSAAGEERPDLRRAESGHGGAAARRRPAGTQRRCAAHPRFAESVLRQGCRWLSEGDGAAAAPGQCACCHAHAHAAAAGSDGQ